jgi:hypothetical protein
MLNKVFKIIALLFILSLLAIPFTTKVYAEAWNSTYKELTTTLTIGEWVTNYWQEDTFYRQGDVVFFEGNYYIAIKRFVPWNIEPVGHPASWVFWEPEE